jgi:hypothetical protein
MRLMQRLAQRLGFALAPASADAVEVSLDLRENISPPDSGI